MATGSQSRQGFPQGVAQKPLDNGPDEARGEEPSSISLGEVLSGNNPIHTREKPTAHRGTTGNSLLLHIRIYVYTLNRAAEMAGAGS